MDIYLIIVAFLLVLAVFDLFVGVSNDAVNFLNSSIGSKVASYRTVLIIASIGVLIGAVMSAGMMDVARHGILQPDRYTFHEVIVIFLAVMVTDVIVLDVFNTLGMPTSTTVSLVFELLGGAFIMAMFKMYSDPSLMLSELLNSDKALSVIIAIFVSVAIAFVCGVTVQWLTRTIFTFNYKKHLRYTIAIFGGIAFTMLAYFIFIKGLGKSPYISKEFGLWIEENTAMLMISAFVVSALICEGLHLLKIDVFKIVVLMGTFALAMAFAGNDLVNFIGVPLAGLDGYLDYKANGNGMDDTYLMTILMGSAKAPFLYLFLAGLVMIISLAISKKARNVTKTEVGLGSQDESDEMFGSSRAARSIVRATRETGKALGRCCPKSIANWINARFNKNEVILNEGAAFDEIRAAINLVLSATLIVIGTNYKLPLSTTYVTFMVAMGSSLADRAWSRESAVFRVTGVLSVIGGWFITAGVAFISCAIICSMMFFGGPIIMFAFIALVIFLLIRSNLQFAKKHQSEEKVSGFQLMMRTRDPELVWEMLQKHVLKTMATVNKFALHQYNEIVDSLAHESPAALRKCNKELKEEQKILKKYRRQELLGLKKSPSSLANERNTWFHLGFNSNEQFIYSLRRMLEPVKEHIENQFNPMPNEYVKEFNPYREKVNKLMKDSLDELESGRFDNFRLILSDADHCKDDLSLLRDHHLERMRKASNNTYHVDMIYLNLIQETQEFLSVMRHQLRTAEKFTEKN